MHESSKTHISIFYSSHEPEVVELEKDPTAVRKVQKAGREKLRRDQLNEQFSELGNTLEPLRFKNDKGTILKDTIQTLMDLSTEVGRLKAEFATLSIVSYEERNELREAKESLKSDIENLKVQYQKKLKVMSPCAPTDPSQVIDPRYRYPLRIAVAPGPIQMRPSPQPFLFFGSKQIPNAILSSCSTYIPANLTAEQQSGQYQSIFNTSSKINSKSKSVDNSSDVVTDLELRMPGSSTQQDLLTREKKAKQISKKDKSIANRSSSSRFFLPNVVGFRPRTIPFKKP